MTPPKSRTELLKEAEDNPINETSKTICIFEAFDMKKFFYKEGLIDTLHTMLTKGKNIYDRL